MKIYRFRNCYLHTAERRVLKDGTYLDVTTKTFDVLLLLIESGGEIVTKDEILNRVWNGSFVEEANLAVHISKLRRLLEENRNQPFIETIQGTGYRFLARVEETPLNEWEKISSGIKTTAEEKPASEWRFDSIAVMPLLNEASDEEIEYLADGLTESFINSLSRLPNLRVIARNTVFRYKNKPIDIKEVGETLGVATLLTGRIRIIKDRLTIGIELTKIQDGTQLWGTHFNLLFTDVFEIQERILSEVLEILKSEIYKTPRQNFKNSITENPESYRLFLKGKYLLDKRIEEFIYKAINCFQKAISLDPINVYSYVEIVEAFGLLYISGYISFNEFSTKIEPFLRAISQLDQSIDVVQTMYGRIAYFDWKFEKAEKHLLHALSLNPNSLLAHYRYAGILITTRNFPQVLRELNHIIHIDPLSFRSYIHVGRGFYAMEQYESAIIYLNDALDLEPNNYEALAVLGATFVEMKRFEDALTIFQKSLTNYYNVEILSMIGCTRALLGQDNEAYKIIEQIKTDFSNSNEFSTILSRIYIALNEHDIACNLLEEAYLKHEADLTAIIVDPRLKKIRSHPRFKAILLKMGVHYK